MTVMIFSLDNQSNSLYSVYKLKHAGKKMEFVLSEICQILEIGIDRAHQWLKGGFVAPSIRKAAGRGKRNVFSRLDLYRFAILKFFSEGEGLSRETSGKLIQALSKDILLGLTSIWLFDRMALIEGSLRNGEFGESIRAEFAKAGGMSPNSPLVSKALQVMSQVILEWLRNRMENTKVYLVFFRTDAGGEFTCLPLGEGVEGKGQKQVSVLGDLREIMHLATVAYVVDFGSIAGQVDERIYNLYPQKFSGEFGRELTKASGGDVEDLEKMMAKAEERSKAILGLDPTDQLPWSPRDILGTVKRKR